MSKTKTTNMDYYFNIRGTEDRTGSKYNYIICVNESLRKRLGKFAIVVHQNKNYSVPLRAYGRVLVNNSLKDDEVMLDQTLRIAIGISYNNDSFHGFEEKVKLYPLKISLINQIKNFVASIFAVRYIYCRYNVPNIIDAEKNLIRIPADAFDLLGCKSGDTVICEFPKKINEEYVLITHRVQGYTSTDRMIEERIKIENNENDPNHARYLSSLRLLGLQPDIPRIFIDYHIREKLGAKELQPIAVRRDVKDLFLKRSIEFGLILMITLITMVSVLPGDVTWKKFVVTSFVSIFVSVTLVLLNIRSSLK